MESFGIALGAGGPVGVAWEVGVLGGLAESVGFDANQAAVIVGTSAGSIVGALIRRGLTAADMVAQQRDTTPRQREVLDPDAFAQVLPLFAGSDLSREEAVRKIVEVGLAAKTPPVQPVIDQIGAVVRGSEWPRADLRITAVDCETCELKVWTAADGVGLDQAVTSSIAVPAIIGPVVIDGRRYLDGGVDSPSHADLLLGTGVRRGIFIGPLGGELMPGPAAMLDHERQRLVDGGVPMFMIVPGERYGEVALDPMNAANGPIALEIGQADGRAVGAALQNFLAG
jgi:NTE family protein